MKLIKLFVLIYILLASPFSFAGHNGRYLSSYEPSYFIWAKDDDDSYIRFKVSVKYPISRCKNSHEHDACDNEDGLWYFAYTGAYDFFVDVDGYGRESSPIVSRLQNPGVFYKWRFDGALDSLSVGYFHESNGQHISDPQIYNVTNYASDYVSRGWDYLGIDLKSTSPFPEPLNDPHTYYLRLRYFCDCQAFGTAPREDDVSIFGINDNLKIEDFDGLRLLMRNEITSQFSYALSLRTGTHSLFKNNTFQAELTYDVYGWPISLIYFDGYGKNISTYHEKDKYVGIGIKLW